jgi:hypothetical protein
MSESLLLFKVIPSRFSMNAIVDLHNIELNDTDDRQTYDDDELTITHHQMDQ